MMVVNGLTPNSAYLHLLALATRHPWRVEESRVGVCRDLGAVTVELDVGERTIFLNGRGWNPAFALVEAAWIIEGRNDLQPLVDFIRRFDEFSDDGETLHGAYGYRLRNYFGRDQLDAAVTELSEHPNTRRVVLSLYAPSDLGLNSKDIPCNTQIVFRRVEGRLEMTVFNRSNDLWLGVPYNWFVFRVLQHYIASRLKIQCGIQRHVSSCLHLYDKHFDSAQRVVCSNSKAELTRNEAELIKLDIDGFLDDVSVIASRLFDRLSSVQLSNAFKRYKKYSDSGVKTLVLPPPLDVLAASLDQWNLARHSSEVNTVANTFPYVGGENETHLKIQHWIFNTPPELAGKTLGQAAMRAFPHFQEALYKEMGPGVKICFEGAAAQHNATLHFVLELILGTLDLELVRTSMGDCLRNRVSEIGSAAGLPSLPFKVRETSDTVLLEIFQDLLSADAHI